MKRLFLAMGLSWCALGFAQVQADFTNGLVAYYPFNGNANDESGNGNQGNVSFATLTNDRFGSVSSAYAFDGTALITVPDSPSLRISNEITITCWVRLAQTNLNVRFVGKGGDCGRNYGLWRIGAGGNFWMLQQFPPQGGCVGCQENTTSPTPSVDVGVWYHMVGVRSGGYSKLYINGVLLADADGQPQTCADTTYTGSEPLLIGAPGYVGPPGNQTDLMHGVLDDIRVYSRGLSSNEVAALYAMEAGPQVKFVKAFTIDYANLTIGSNYQLQASTDMNTWTNWGGPFTATNVNYTNTSYQRIDDWRQLFFRLQQQ